MTNEKVTVFKSRNNNRDSKGGSVRLGIYKIKDKVKLNPDHDLVGIKDITQPSTTDDTGLRIIKPTSLLMSQNRKKWFRSQGLQLLATVILELGEMTG